METGEAQLVGVDTAEVSGCGAGVCDGGNEEDTRLLLGFAFVLVCVLLCVRVASALLEPRVCVVRDDGGSGSSSCGHAGIRNETGASTEDDELVCIRARL
jgi:hypothetical protein